MSEGKPKKAAKAASHKIAALSASDYVHLHNHSHYSVLDGLQKVPDMLDRVKELGMEAVALTDHGTMSGIIEFYKGAKERGIKPIIGMEAYVANRRHTDKDPQVDRSRYHLILLAMNNTGYQNLMRLNSIANLDGFYFKPRIDHELLEKYSEGLIALSGCIGGEVGEQLRNGDLEKAEQFARWYKDLFGDRYYMEIQDHGHMWDEQKRVNALIVDLAKKLDIPLVVTCDAHYSRHEDQEAHEILLCVQTGSFLTDANRFSLTDTDLYVTDPQDVIKRWGDVYPAAIRNTREIADRCNVEIELGKILIPKFPVPSGEDERSYLHKLTYAGLLERMLSLDPNEAASLDIDEAKKRLSKEALERTEYELSVIESMGFNGYFLIIWDFIKWGKDNGIVFGPGRGSAAGSIVAYALRITDLDPLEYGLLFERFLNPDRISMPDIDIDIQDTRRDEVIQYVSDKYGKDRVANIVTFGKMFARNAVRDVARVLQVPYADADRLAKMIPPPVQGRHIPLKKSLEENAELKSEYASSEVARRVFDLAVRLEGTVRSHGIHAAGVVIAPEELVKYAPLEMAQKGVVATQYSMGPVEELGLLKMDFLGLSNLTIIKNSLRIIKKVYKKDIDIGEIPLDDKKTFELLQRGETTGVFQLESAGMKRYLKELKPSVFDDIVAMVALYRPGPMQFIDDFIARKHGRREIVYFHPKMADALASTYGVLVYQEQVMQISKDLSGFSGGQADTLRKAIGKKQIETMAKMKEAFIDGAIKNSKADRPQMEIFWKQLEDFAAYCFNKSHAACYGLIAYQTADLKAHYPAAFMAALMTNDYDDTDRLSIDITECKHMDIEVLPPDVNQSYHEFAVVDGEDNKKIIRFGMDAIKNVGRGAVEEIIKARENGAFTNLSDLLLGVNLRLANKKNWESLIKAGALDKFGSRGALLNSIDSLLLLANKYQKDQNSAQADLFGTLIGSESVISRPDFRLQEPATPPTKQELLTWERELLGLYLSEHPLSDFEAYLSDHAFPINQLRNTDDSKVATIGGTIAEIKQITTKNGQNMAFARLEDPSGEIEVIVFPSVLKDNAAAWQRDNVVMVTGRISTTDKNGSPLNEPKLLAESVEILRLETVRDYQPTGNTPALKESVRRERRFYKEKTATASAPAKAAEPKLYLRIESQEASEMLVRLKDMLERFSGPTEVVLVMGADQKKQAIRLPHKIKVDEIVMRELTELVGSGNVIAR